MFVRGGDTGTRGQSDRAAAAGKHSSAPVVLLAFDDDATAAEDAMHACTYCPVHTYICCCSDTHNMGWSDAEASRRQDGQQVSSSHILVCVRAVPHQ